MRLLSSKNDLKNLFDTKISNQEVPFFEPSQKLSNKSKTILRRSNFLFDIAEFDQAKDELFSGLGKFKNKNLNWIASNLLDNKGYHKEVIRIIANSFLLRVSLLPILKTPEDLVKVSFIKILENVFKSIVDVNMS